MTPNPEFQDAPAKGSWSSMTDELRTEDCVAPEQFLAEEWAQLDPGTQRRMLDHVAGCPVCQVERRLAEGFDAPAAVTPENQTHRRSHWPTSLAAGVLAALGLGLWMNGQPGLTPELPDAPDSTGIMRGAGIVLDGYSDPAAPTFEWSRVPGAQRYRLTAMDVTDRTIWTAETVSLSMSPDLADADNTGTWRWTVEALGEGGSILAVSPPLAAKMLEPVSTE